MQLPQILTDFILVLSNRLVEWIERCDLASQAGLPKPEFKTADGEDIIPPAAEKQLWPSEEKHTKGNENKMATTIQKEVEREKLHASDDEDDRISEQEQVDVESASVLSRDHYRVPMAWNATR